MLRLFIDNPLLTLFAIIAVGYLLGQIRIGSSSLGVSAVLFTGLGASALWPEIELPEIVYTLGLVLFVYTIGLAAGPGFVASLRNKGVWLNTLGLAVIAMAAAETLLLVALLDLDKLTSTGMFTGALTNTPALAGILDALPKKVGAGSADALAGRAVVGYSLAYPIGVLGTIAAMSVLQRVWRIDHAAEAREAGLAPVELEHWTVRVERGDRPHVDAIPLRSQAHVTASRLRYEGEVHAPAPDEPMVPGAFVTLVGTPSALRKATKWLGVRVDDDLVSDPTMDFRRVFVSDPAVVGVKLAELHLPERHGITITRIQRGDIDVVATAESVLELGDRVRLVAPRDRMHDASRLMGDSYRTLSELDILTFGLGIAVGLGVGLIPLPIPGGGTVHLGVAGGPLLVSIVLGAIGKTGPLVWQVPYSANLTVRQLGVVLFLAAIGTRAGQAFGSAVSDPASLLVIAGGAALTFTVSLSTLVLAHEVMKVPFGQAMGLLGGLQTQPAVLAFANEQTGTELANRGYTTIYPLAMIAKIIAAQILLVVLL